MYGNKEIKVSVQRTDVPDGFVGGWVEYRVPADVYFSDSQEAADIEARADVSANAQAYADVHGDILPAIWYNDRLCGVFVKDDCLSKAGSSEEVCVEEGMFVSYVSKDDANAKARVELDRIGQRTANDYGVCCKDWASLPLYGEFFKNDCEYGMDGKDPVFYELEAGAEVSSISQMDADTKAYQRYLKEGQEKANAEGSCAVVYYNERVSGWFEKSCPFGYKSEKIRYSVEPGRVMSWESVEDANDIARNKILAVEGQEYADIYGECVKWIENIDEIPEGDGCYW